MSRIQGFFWAALVCSVAVRAQEATPAGVPAQIIVTMGHFYSHQPPQLTQEEMVLEQEFVPVPVTRVLPLRGERGALELFVLVDNCSSCEVGPKFQELRKFIVSQGPATAVGVAYIQEGKLQVALHPTKDREKAIAALNPPSGSKPANPFVALTELIENWKPNAARHVVLMISNGIDPATASRAENPSAEAAIRAAQRGAVTVYSIYHPSADYATTDATTIYSGQVQLSHVANETGGEAYLVGFGPLPTLAPFLADLSDHLANQYLVQFLANPANGAGMLLDVTVRSQMPDIELMAPAKAWIPGRAEASKGAGQ